jgi:hypothetical protein
MQPGRRKDSGATGAQLAIAHRPAADLNLPITQRDTEDGKLPGGI